MEKAWLVFRGAAVRQHHLISSSWSEISHTERVFVKLYVLLSVMVTTLFNHQVCWNG